MAEDTIAAIATGSVRSGVGMIRISGPAALAVAQHITHKNTLPPRQAVTSYFFTAPQHGTKVKKPDQALHKTTQKSDFGLVIYFPAPHSFTGEDVIELHGHGNPILLQHLLDTLVDLGCRPARPGEFSQRAFLNNKMDLTQAEAVADLIHAQSIQAAQSAFSSLQGVFARSVHQLQEQLNQLRIYVEAAIDFPDEDMDFLADAMLPEGMLHQRIQAILLQLQQLAKQAQQGVLLQEGIKIVIAGPPNVGKSSLLNLLTGEDTAIISDIAGTTRDLITAVIRIDGLPVQLIDSAGIHNTDHPIEQQGIKKSLAQMQQADLILLVCDSRKDHADSMLHWFQKYHPLQSSLQQAGKQIPVILVQNKIDLLSDVARKNIQDVHKVSANMLAVGISVTENQGINLLKQAIRQQTGFTEHTETPFSARQRHVHILHRVQAMILAASTQFDHIHYGELLAEDLRQAQLALDEITGRHTSDQLLGDIFAGFCIGK